MKNKTCFWRQTAFFKQLLNVLTACFAGAPLMCCLSEST